MLPCGRWFWGIPSELLSLCSLLLSIPSALSGIRGLQGVRSSGSRVGICSLRGLSATWSSPVPPSALAPLRGFGHGEEVPGGAVRSARGRKWPLVPPWRILLVLTFTAALRGPRGAGLPLCSEERQAMQARVRSGGENPWGFHRRCPKERWRPCLALCLQHPRERGRLPAARSQPRAHLTSTTPWARVAGGELCLEHFLDLSLIPKAIGSFLLCWSERLLYEALTCRCPK